METAGERERLSPRGPQRPGCVEKPPHRKMCGPDSFHSGRGDLSCLGWDETLKIWEMRMSTEAEMSLTMAWLIWRHRKWQRPEDLPPPCFPSDRPPMPPWCQMLSCLLQDTCRVLFVFYNDWKTIPEPFSLFFVRDKPISLTLLNLPASTILQQQNSV